MLLFNSGNVLAIENSFCEDSAFLEDYAKRLAQFKLEHSDSALMKKDGKEDSEIVITKLERDSLSDINGYPQYSARFTFRNNRSGVFSEKWKYGVSFVNFWVSYDEKNHSCRGERVTETLRASGVIPKD